MIPRDARAITSWASPEEAFFDVAAEIQKLVAGRPPSPTLPPGESTEAFRFGASLGLVRDQVRSYARLHERTRQRMPASDDRTARMNQIFVQMRAMATASYPLLDELASSPSPGERLAAVAILQVFATEASLPFLVRLVGSEKPFVSYQAIKALHFAVGALDAHVHPRVFEALQTSRVMLESSSGGFEKGRQAVLDDAEQELRALVQSLTSSRPLND